MSQQKLIEPLPYDNHFMQVTSYEEVSQKKLTMTKSDFKKFIAHEKKKEEFNGKLFEYSKEHEKGRIDIKEINRKIIYHDYMIKHLKEMDIKIEGNLETIEALINTTRQRIQRQIDLKNKAHSEYEKLYQKYELRLDEFIRLSSIAHIEEKLYLHTIHTQAREKEEKQEQKTFLNLLGKLPDDLLRIIQTYFTYETRTAILVKTYNPIRMFCALKKTRLNKALTHINKKYAPVNKNFSRAWKIDHEVHNKMIASLVNYAQQQQSGKKK
jgi:hypothetical protein